VALCAAVALVLGATTVVAGAQSGGEKPSDSEIGVTADEIRIAVIADVDTTLAPGLFQGSVSGVQGWAKYMNKNGGLAGRKVVIDFIDSKLTADDARNAVIQACEEDFAIVGTSALFLTNVDDMVGCVDKAGAATGIPDVPVVTTEVVQQCSPVSFPVNPPQIHCDTKDSDPQTYTAQGGRARYFLKEVSKDLQGSFILSGDLPSPTRANLVTATGVIKQGIKDDAITPISARAPQSAYTPVVQQMREDGSNYAESGSNFASTVSLRKEAKLQGLNPDDITWACTVQCYDQKFIEQGGADVENEYVSVTFVPFEEASANKMTANFLKFTGKDKADGFGAQAWIAGIFLRDAVEAVVKADGVNGVTRAAVLEQMNNTNGFNADGMAATTDIGDRKVSPCYALVQVQNGEFKRVYPKKAATFDCNKKNNVTFDLAVGG
jgi:hypothetical protein